MHGQKNIKLHNTEQAKSVYHYLKHKNKFVQEQRSNLVQRNMQSKADNTNLRQHKNSSPLPTSVMGRRLQRTKIPDAV